MTYVINSVHSDNIFIEKAKNPLNPMFQPSSLLLLCSFSYQVHKNCDLIPTLTNNKYQIFIKQHFKLRHQFCFL